MPGQDLPQGVWFQNLYCGATMTSYILVENGWLLENRDYYLFSHLKLAVQSLELQIKKHKNPEYDY